MAPLILKVLLLSSIPLSFFLIGKTTPQVTCVFNPFLLASNATLWVSITRWFDFSRLTRFTFFTLFELSLLLIKMHLRLKLKLSVNNQDKPSPRFSRVARFSPQHISCRGCPQWNSADHFYCRFVQPHCSVGVLHSETRRYWLCVASSSGNPLFPWNQRFKLTRFRC